MYLNLVLLLLKNLLEGLDILKTYSLSVNTLMRFGLFLPRVPFEDGVRLMKDLFRFKILLSSSN